MKIYSEADVRELLVFAGAAADYKTAGDMIEAAERDIERRALAITTTTHRLCGDRIVAQFIRELSSSERTQGWNVNAMRERLRRASEGAGC